VAVDAIRRAAKAKATRAYVIESARDASSVLGPRTSARGRRRRIYSARETSVRSSNANFAARGFNIGREVLHVVYVSCVRVVYVYCTAVPEYVTFGR